MRHIGSHIMIDNFTFNIAKEFIYLSSVATTKHDVSLQIKRRITVANKCYYSLNRQLSSESLSHTTKLLFYKTLILLVLLYGNEEWTLSTEAAAL